MRQVTISELKRLKAGQIREQCPFEIISDGNVIALVLFAGPQRQETPSAQSPKNAPTEHLPRPCDSCKLYAGTRCSKRLPEMPNCLSWEKRG